MPVVKRNIQQLQKHLIRCNSCKNTISFCYRQPTINKIEVIKTFFHCNSYFCETCANRKRRLLEKKFKNLKFNGRLRFLTLTLSTNQYTPEQALERISGFCNDFCHRLRDRKYKFQFFKIIELTKNNQAHLHILINCFIPKDIVTKIWKDITGSYITDIRAIPNKQKAVDYLLKYMTKAINSTANYLFFLLRKRRYSYSQNFFLDTAESEKFIKSFIHFHDDVLFFELLNKFVKRRFWNSKLLDIKVLNHWQDYKISYS
jgi:hypothetical protein